MTFDNLLIERDDPVAIVTIIRPRVLNALNTPTFLELRHLLTALQGDQGVRARAHAHFSRSESRPSQVGNQNSA